MFKGVKFCMMHEIPFRGHEDWGKMTDFNKPQGKTNATEKYTLGQLIEELDTFSLYFPNIMRLFTIFACTPVSTATAERSFSMLTRIFSDLRSTMGDERLSNLAIGSFFWKECQSLPLEELANEFAMKSRRIPLK